MKFLLRREYYERGVIYALCAVPIVAMLAPRIVGIAPSLIALAGLPAFRVSYGRWPEMPRVLLFWSLAFPALMALSALWSIVPAQSLILALKTLPVTAGGGVLIALALEMDESAKALFRRFFPAALLGAAAILAFDYYSSGGLYYLSHEPRADGRFGYSKLNRSVVVLSLGAFIAALSLWRRDARERTETIRVGIAIMVALFAVMLKAGSAASQLGLCLGAATAFLFPARFKAAWAVFAGVLIGLTCAAPWLSQFMFHEFGGYFARSGAFSDAYIPNRLDIWDFVSRRALERPWLGHGADATPYIKDFDASGLYWKSRQVLHPHNFAVQLWLEFGVLGPLLASAFFWDLTRRLKRRDILEQRIFAGLLVAVLTVAASAFGLWQIYLIGLTGYLAACGVAAGRVSIKT